MIQNDIHAHNESVDSLKEAGSRVLATERGMDIPVKRKLNDVNDLWDKVQGKADDKYQQLKEALREVCVTIKE